MYDPRRTDALVMPRPPLDHVLHTPQLVDVVLDPYVGRHLRSVFVVIVIHLTFLLLNQNYYSFCLLIIVVGESVKNLAKKKILEF
jgi:hypothetical protein